MKKIWISPLQNRVMWILEEAGAETEATIIATLRSEGYDDDLLFRDAVQGLERLGLICREGAEYVLTEAGYGAITQ